MPLFTTLSRASFVGSKTTLWSMFPLPLYANILILTHSSGLFFAPFDLFYSFDFNVPFSPFFFHIFPFILFSLFIFFPPKSSTDITPHGVRGIFPHIYCTPTTLSKKLLRMYQRHPRISKWEPLPLCCLGWHKKIVFRNLKVLLKRYRFYNENVGLKDYKKSRKATVI
jgi:hypothetical protein